MEKTMETKLRVQSCSDNRKSKIKNPIWVSLFAVVLAFVGLAGMVEAQQAKKIPRIGYLSNSDAATESTRAEAIMMGVGRDPVEASLIESLARPGGSVTGLTNLNRELGGKRLELLKEAVPKVARVAVLYDPASPTIAIEVKEDLPVAASS